MKPSTWFNLGAAVLFLHATGHTLGGVIFYHPHTPAEATVISAMQSSQVAVMGATRSLWDFYYGSGLAIGALALAGFAWAAGRLLRQTNAALGALVLFLIAGCLSQTLICLRYFFALPAVLTLLAALLCGAGWLRHRAASKTATL